MGNRDESIASRASILNNSLQRNSGNKVQQIGSNQEMSRKPKNTADKGILPMAKQMQNNRISERQTEKPSNSLASNQSTLKIKFNTAQESVVSQEKLEEAIIWSELLAKPLSKRRKRRL